MDNRILINKIAAEIGCDNGSEYGVKNHALKLASDMLKVAAEKLRESELKNAEISSQLDNIQKDNEHLQKVKMAEEVVSIMFNKGLIRKSDKESKIQELSEMDTKALEVMRETMMDITEKTASEFVSDLTFLSCNNIVEEESNIGTMGNAIVKYI